jgi:uncharacterized protein (TIGR02145 family)
MSELRIGTANSEPAAGTLKVGSTDVQEIYLGSTKIWPAEAPPNTTTLEGSEEIQFASDASQANSLFSQSKPTWVWFNFDSINSSRGRFYNKYAARIITPPTGFRLPTANDFDALFNYLISSEGFNRFTNIGGGNPNFWKANTVNNSVFGTSGFNAICAGLLVVNSNGSWGINPTYENYWDQTAAYVSNAFMDALSDQDGYILKSSLGQSYNQFGSIRFCKDA